MTNTQFTLQLAFYRQQQQRNKHCIQQPSLTLHNSSHQFSFNGRGFQAQQLRDRNRRYFTPNTQQ